MKKLISLLTSITLCVGAMSATTATSIVANATEYYFNLNYAIPSICVKSEELSAIFDFDVYYSLDTETYPITETHFFAYENQYDSFSTLHPGFGNYNWLTEEEATLLSDYVTANYQDVLVTYPESEESTSETIKIRLEFTDEFDFTVESLAKLSLDIYENTGLKFSYVKPLNIDTLILAGDLTLDNALTPVDASMLLSYYADAQSGVAVASAESGVDYSIIGDFNSDGVVTPTDASEILSYYADQQTA